MKENFEDKLIVFNYKDFGTDFSTRFLYNHGMISKTEFEKSLRKIKLEEINKINENNT